MADAGFRLTVEGEKEFKDALAAADAAVKRSTDQIKLLTEQFRLSDDSMEGLTEKQKALEEAYASQTEKVKLLEAQYAKMAESTDKNAAGMSKLEGDLAKARLEQAKMSNAVKENQEQIDAARESTEKFQAGLEEYQENTRRLEQYLSELGTGIEETDRQLAELANQYDSLGGSSKELREKQKNLKEQNELLSDQMNKQQRIIETLNRELKNAEKLYGQNSDEVDDYRKKIDAATEELADMKIQMDKNNDALKDVTDEGGNDLFSILEQVGDMTGVQIPENLKDMLGRIDDVTTKFGGWAVAIGGAISANNELQDKLHETADKYKDLYTEAASFGMDTTEYQKLQYSMERVGIESSELEEMLNELKDKMKESQEAAENYDEAVEKLAEDHKKELEELEAWRQENTPEWDQSAEDLFESYEKYEKEMAEFTDEYNRKLREINDEYADSVAELEKETEEADAVFKELGVTIVDENGNLRNTADVIYEVLGAYGRFADGTDRIAKLQEIFGESAGIANLAVNAGYENLKKYAEQAEEMGLIIDEVTINSMSRMSTESDILSKKFEVLGDKWNTFLYNLTDISGWGAGNISRSASSLWDSITGLFKRGYATGTYNHPGGYAVVGERGPEIVDLPRGSKVYPNGELPDGMGSTVNYINVTIPASDIKEFNDIIRIVQSQRQSIRGGYVGR